MDDITQVDVQEHSAPAETTETTSTQVDTAPEPVVESAEENQYLLPVDVDETQNTDNPQQITDGLKPYLEISPYINSPESLQGAIADSHLLWDVVNGQQPAGAILEGLKQGNQQAWQNVVNGLAQYIQQETGYAFVNPQQLPQQEVDPVQARLNAIENQFRQQEQAREEQVFQYRAQQAQSALLNHLNAALKGSFLEGEEGQVLTALGQKLGDPVKVIDAIEKGDFKPIDSALKAIKREETERYNRYVKRVGAQRKGLANSLPKVDNPGAKATPKGNFDLNTREGRIAYALSLGK